MLGTLLDPGTGALILVNGAYGRRMVEICRRLGRRAEAYAVAETMVHDPAEVARRLAADPGLTHVVAIQCETTSGILNPVAEIGKAVAGAGRRLLIDAMSGFGAIPLGSGPVSYDALAASSNKCIQGVPGLGFVICRTDALLAAKGNAPSLSLDLHDQWRGFEGNGQWRYTPPTQVLAAFRQALREHAEEGGVEGRGARYRRNCGILVEGMKGLGFEPLLPAALQAPIIVTFRIPGHPGFGFEALYEGMKDRGFVIYPGKITEAETFRIGCIGDLDEADMRAAVAAAAAALADMGVDLRGVAA
jgi:2-aminoethylphosphonate-pyruvate transaminase